MSNTIYGINKGINRPLEFRGLQAQYIWYFAGGLVSVLTLFSILYIAGLNAYLTLLIGVCLGGFVFFLVYRLNNTYGQYGWMRKAASSKVPKAIKSKSRKFLMSK